MTQYQLKELLDYEPPTGIFRWKVRTSNRVRIGAVAGCIMTDTRARTSYRCIGIDGKRHYAHRLAYLYMTGKMPPGELDVAHDDQDGLNNRWANLRLINQAENSKNQRLPKNNASGVIGVSWYKPSQKWAARIAIHGNRIHLGYFTRIDGAIAARAASEKHHGFHALHGSG